MCIFSFNALHVIYFKKSNIQVVLILSIIKIENLKTLNFMTSLAIQLIKGFDQKLLFL